MVLNAFIFFLSMQAAQALPPYANLFKAKYGFKPNCTLCHDPDSWEPNGYGKLFLKNGRSLEALSKTESLDPDEDTFISIKEVQAKSNPGDPRSTPQRVGDWLKDIPPVEPPRKHLLALFLGAVEYKYHERNLDEPTRRKIEKSLGTRLRDEDVFPSYFTASKKGELAGIALYASTPGDKPCFFLSGYRPSGEGELRVAGIRVLECEEKALKKSPYLNQFVGKLPVELKTIKPPKESLAEPSNRIVETVQRGAAVLKEILETAEKP